MESTKKEEVPAAADAAKETEVAQKRVDLGRVVIDAPALLSMVKYCQNGAEMLGYQVTQQLRYDQPPVEKTFAVKGMVMGVLNKEVDSSTNLLINGSRILQLDSTKKQISMPKQTGVAYNEVGFFVCQPLGLAFSRANLMEMVAQYRNFRNSVMLVYDTAKSEYGLNPLKCFRLSEGAIKALQLNDSKHQPSNLLQSKIREHDLNITNFFDEVPMKIHRSHLLQAFLFDHIAPKMPAFNTNLLQLGQTSQHMVQHLSAGVEKSATLYEELQKIENVHKNQNKAAKRAAKKIQSIILANKDKSMKGSLADEEERAALAAFKVDDSEYNKMDMFLFSKQVDTLYQDIAEFDSCFPEESKLDYHLEAPAEAEAQEAA